MQARKEERRTGCTFRVVAGKVDVAIEGVASREWVVLPEGLQASNQLAAHEYSQASVISSEGKRVKMVCGGVGCTRLRAVRVFGCKLED